MAEWGTTNWPNYSLGPSALAPGTYGVPIEAPVVNLVDERLRREIDELRAELNNLAHRLNQAIVNLQGQLDDKVNAEPVFQP